MNETEKELTEEELIAREPKNEIVWVNGMPCIKLPEPKVKVKVIKLPKGKNPFDILIDEIEKFMGDMFDAD